MLTIPTEALHGYSIKFSPFTPNKLACVACQQYGIQGSGTLLVVHFDYEKGEAPFVVKSATWNDGLFDVCWSELDENICATAGGDGSLHLWNQDVSEPLAVKREHEKEVYSVDWSHKGNKNLLVTASWDSLCKVFDAGSADLPCLSTFSGHQGVVYSAVWSPRMGDTFASTSADGTLRVWDIRKGPAPQIVVAAHETEILTCDWSKYDPYMIVTGSVDCSLRAWDIRNPQTHLSQMLGHGYAVRRLKTSPFNANIVVSCSYDFTVRVWDMFKPQTFSPLLETIERHSEFVYGLDLSTFVPGLVADCSWDQTINLHKPRVLI